MDALSLVLPAATIANPGSTGADTSAPGTGSEAAPVDFAALLAAGLMPQPDMAGNLSVPPAGAQTTDPAAEHEGDESPMDAAARSLAGLQGAFHPNVIGNASGMHKGDQASAVAADAAALDAAMTAAHGKADADIAAEAATIAGAAAQTEVAVLGDQDARASEPSGASDAVHGASSEASPSLGHLLHLGGSERPSTTRPSAMLEVGAPVDGPDFAQALSQQVVWMADKDAQIAELRINPPELGPVEVRLQISGDEAVVQFASAQPEVRNAIEAAMARLRESMAQAGIQLGDASVSAESFREQGAHHSGAGEGRSSYRNGAEPREPAWTPAPIATGVRRGLVDLFA
jgi:flagellar hook-length control protein FliK